MEEFVEKTLLFDFYGELLTEHQRRIYQEIVFNDYSPSEVARDEGVSRQGIHDLMKRCDRILEDYEARLGLVARFLQAREKIKKIQDLTAGDDRRKPADRMEEIRRISEEILEEL